MKTYTDHTTHVSDPATGSWIPKNGANKDWQRVLAEVAAGTAQISPPSP